MLWDRTRVDPSAEGCEVASWMARGWFSWSRGAYYCGIGADKGCRRDIVDAHYKACLYAEINISGINGEVMPGQAYANHTNVGCPNFKLVIVGDGGTGLMKTKESKEEECSSSPK